MDRIRSTFSNMIASERYSRFTLQSTEDGERHAVVKLSDDAAEAEAEAEAGDSPTFRPMPRRSRRNLVYLALGTLLIFFIGFFIGYASHTEPQVEPVNCPAGQTQSPEQVTQAPIEPEVRLNWESLTNLLTDGLSIKAFDKTLETFEASSRIAGSVEDMKLANSIFETFKELQMDPWTDAHYVELPEPDSQHPNLVEFDSVTYKPTGYLAYSACGSVTGELVYGNYGRKEDLAAVLNKGVALNGSVLLLRAGKISFAEQVDHAESLGAAAVLIYPDAQDFNYRADTPLYGQVHLGSGDPYTPGFPSFNHTQFPPTRSSGLPKIPAQTIDGNTASKLLGKIGGPASDAGFKGSFTSVDYKLGGTENVTVQVNNVLVNKRIHNVFGVVKGFTDPDQYIVLGAQRDAWGPGYAKATVGSSVLVELARTFQRMVQKEGFVPRRSLVFASFSAGEFGSVGATEWLEAHMSSIGKNVFTYISLDAVVTGRGSFIASASPLLYSLLESTMKEVKSPVVSGIMSNMVGKKWESAVMRPMPIDDPAYPFLAFSGIPSISFHFISPNTESYSYFGTALDNKDHLRYATSHNISEMTVAAAQLAGRMALRLVHDHVLNFDVTRYRSLLFKSVRQVNKRVFELSQSGQLTGVSTLWLSRAQGSFLRAADKIQNDRLNTDLNDQEACRILNNRLMMIENALISPYVSAVETPFRHLLFGRGPHTLESIAMTNDTKELHTQLALATWSLQGCANAMVGNIWDIDNEI